MNIKANQDESYLHPKEVLITTFLREVVVFNQGNAGGLGSGKKVAVELDGIFKREIIKL